MKFQIRVTLELLGMAMIYEKNKTSDYALELKTKLKYISSKEDNKPWFSLEIKVLSNNLAAL